MDFFAAILVQYRPCNMQSLCGQRSASMWLRLMSIACFAQVCCNLINTMLPPYYNNKFGSTKLPPCELVPHPVLKAAEWA